MTVHVYTRGHQAATRHRFYLDMPDGTVKTFTTRINPRATVPTSCCRKRRWAKHCTVQVYYDMTPFWCRVGRGCKR